MKPIVHARAAVVAATALVLSACAAPPMAAPSPAPVVQPTATGSMAGMDHGATTMDAPFDAMFIDGMIKHHEGAITMAGQALKEAQRPETRALAENIIQAQQAEIEQMTQWRAAWYPDLKDTGGMPGMDMGPMMVPAGEQPFDIRFIDAMIPHHESAIGMAKEAQQKAEKPEIKTLATAIIAAQTAEIEQMKTWRAAWAK